jgi:hypothetical protein
MTREDSWRSLRYARARARRNPKTKPTIPLEEREGLVTPGMYDGAEEVDLGDRSYRRSVWEMGAENWKASPAARI